MGSILIPVSQRRAIRHAARVTCQVVRERDFKLLSEQAVDLSIGGMLILTDERVLTGEDVIISLRAPGIGSWFDAQGTIARVVHGRRPSDFGRALGVRFHGLDMVSRSYLRAGLRSLPPAIPAREPRIDYAASVSNIMNSARMS